MSARDGRNTWRTCMADKVVVIAPDPDKARLLALRNKPTLTPQEVKEAITLLMKKMGIE